MKRIDTRLHDFVRTTWVSSFVREKWEPRLQHLRKEVERVEVQSVAAGIRPSAMIQVDPSDMPETAQRLARRGLTFVPQSLQNTGTAEYAASAREDFAMDRPWKYRGLFTRLDNLRNMPDSNSELGRLLGYPACCIDFFGETWVGDRYLDTTWPQGMRSGVTPDEDSRTLNIREWSSGANVTWRWLGIRAVPYLPCSFNCAASAELARSFISLMDAEAQEVIEQVLSWPLEWSVLHGIAEVKTPILRFVATSDFALDKHLVRLHSSVIPDEMPAGTEFPYRKRIGLMLTQTKAYQSAKQALSGS